MLEAAALRNGGCSPRCWRLQLYALVREAAAPCAQVWCGCCSHQERRALRCTWKSPPGVPQPTDDNGRPVSWSLSDGYVDQLGAAAGWQKSQARMHTAGEQWRATAGFATMGRAIVVPPNPATQPSKPIQPPNPATQPSKPTQPPDPGPGAALLPLLAAIPAGVLVFVPSYGLLERLSRRWKQTGLWDALLRHKPCLRSEAAARPPAETKQVLHYTRT